MTNLLWCYGSLFGHFDLNGSLIVSMIMLHIQLCRAIFPITTGIKSTLLICSKTSKMLLFLACILLSKVFWFRTWKLPCAPSLCPHFIERNFFFKVIVCFHIVWLLSYNEHYTFFLHLHSCFAPIHDFSCCLLKDHFIFCLRSICFTYFANIFWSKDCLHDLWS